MKNVLNLYIQDVHKGGGIVNFLHGGYRYFLEQPILWKHKKYCQGINYHVFLTY